MTASRPALGVTGRPGQVPRKSPKRPSVARAAPELTSRKLTAFNAWLLAHGRAVLVIGLMVAGAALATDGLFGLFRGA